MTTPLIEIINLHVSVEDNEILKGVDLTVQKGEVHSIMGPNGSGKSTLACVLAGHEAYEVTQGEVKFNGIDLLELDADQRACAGVFLAFQYPVEIPGVNTATFLRTSLNEVRKHNGLEPLNGAEFIKLMKEKMKVIDIDKSLINRSVNEGFSGGEKKKAEIFQMALLEPKLSILDETDSGLDIDALKVVSDGVNKLGSNENAVVIITHYQRLLDHIVPDYVHILFDGKIIKSGGKEMALMLEEKGYDWIKSNYDEPVNA